MQISGEMMRDLAKVLAVVGLSVLFTAIIALSASTNQEKSDVITLVDLSEASQTSL